MSVSLAKQQIEFQDSTQDQVIVAILAAYPSVRAGLASLLHMDPGIRATSAQLDSLFHPGTATPAIPSAAQVMLVDPLDVPTEALSNLVTLAHSEELPVLWVGHPTVSPGRLHSVVRPDSRSETLIAAVHAIANGLVVSDPGMPADDFVTQPRGTVDGGVLSPREVEVLQLVASGLPNKAIARELSISDHTVKFHVSSLLSKLGAGSRTEAVTIATRRGLLSL